MPKTDTEVIDSIVKRWIRFRKDFQARKDKPSQGDVKKFVTTATGLSRELLSALNITSPEYAEALGELSMHAHADMVHPRVMDV
jgi:hypothetical protein